MKIIKSLGKDLGILLLYMLMVCSITFGILWAIYSAIYFKPKEAYVYLNYDRYNYEVDYVEAKHLFVKNNMYYGSLIRSYFLFDDETKIDFSNFNVIYDGVVYPCIHYF